MMARKVKQIRIPKKKSKRNLQQWLKQRLVKNPKKRRTKRRTPTYQRGKGVVLGLLGGLIPLIVDLIRKV